MGGRRSRRGGAPGQGTAVVGSGSGSGSWSGEERRRETRQRGAASAGGRWEGRRGWGSRRSYPLPICLCASNPASNCSGTAGRVGRAGGGARGGARRRELVEAVVRPSRRDEACGQGKRTTFWRSSPSTGAWVRAGSRAMARGADGRRGEVGPELSGVETSWTSWTGWTARSYEYSKDADSAKPT